jgi:hypothetical protein
VIAGPGNDWIEASDDGRRDTLTCGQGRDRVGYFGTLEGADRLIASERVYVIEGD